ncbi:hypothetical protein FRB94_008136 [Tulasnella sp. JGI-2019a]|nr:hypothetical protein FRB94_008136 [Tulasnella sp. JGI-2019a]KAG9017311.1 hypothetical protein FRB93_007425 [Tulasnella sp. JGI-2019a]KAG9026466.1 hypothetical protein FRB95_008838 [Tulasnella sp. JGI-2019a]
MSTLSPPVITRARSSSTVGPITTARSRTVSYTKSPTKSKVSSSSASTTTSLAASASSSGTALSAGSSSSSSSSMFDAMIQIASRLIPFHDSLSTSSSQADPPSYSSSPASTINEKELEGAVVGEGVNEKAGWMTLVDAPSSERSAKSHRARPPPLNVNLSKLKTKRLRRPLSPFSSLFITPPSRDGLPPPVSSPRTSGSFSRLNSLSISIPTGNNSAQSTYQSHRSSPRLITPLLTVCLLFFVTFIPTLVLVYTLPIPSLKSLPRTVSDIKLVAKELQLYSASSKKGAAHILAVLAVTSVWKNAWSVPGSVLLNVLAGALMNPILATILQTFLTTVGSLCSSLLSKPLAPVISKLFPKALNLTRSAFEGGVTSPVASPEISPVIDSEDEESEGDDSGQPLLTRREAQQSQPSSPAPTPIWVRLTILRLIGVVPWSALNLACGICNVPLWDCAIGAFIGVLPWTAVTCQIGDLLQTVAVKTSTSPDAPAETLSSLLSSPSIIVKLIVLSLISLGPVLLRDKLGSIIARHASGRSSSSRRTEEVIDLASSAEEKTRIA